MRRNERAHYLAYFLLVSSFILLGAPLNPFIVVDQIERRVNPNSLLDPNSLVVAEFNQEFEAFLQIRKPTSRSSQVQALLDPQVTEIESVEAFVRSCIKYHSDFFQYLALDHLATDIEIVKKRNDDCDGRAILAASLLLHRGYDAWIIVAPRHYCVEIILGSGRVLHILEEKRAGEWYLKFNGTQMIYHWPMVLMLVGSYVTVTILALMLPIGLYRILTKNTLYRTLVLFVLVIYFGFIVSVLLVFG